MLRHLLTVDATKGSRRVDYPLNSVAAGKILMTDNGILTDSGVLAAITPSLKPSHATVMKFPEDIKPDITVAPPIPPVGASEIQKEIVRRTTAALFDRATPAKAAETFVAEVQSM